MMGARSLRGRLSGASAAALLGLLLASASAIAPAEADKVGVAAAVNPDAFSTLVGAPQSQINIGKSIFYNERINTTTSGIVQVLLIDGSTFTVGPGSDLVIDKFVYDPKTGTGQIAASFSKGVMRFVGGKISKNEDSVAIKTSAGALAVRGGMFYGLVDGRRGLFPFLFGDELKLTLSNGQVLRAFQQRYTIDTEKGIRPTTPEDIDLFMKAFGGKGVAGKSKDGAGGPKDANTNELVQDANATRIQDQLQSQAGRPSGFGETSSPGGGGGTTGGGNTGGGGIPTGDGGSGVPGGTPEGPPPVAALQGVGWGVGGTPPCPNCVPLEDGGGPPGLTDKASPPGLGGGLPPGLSGVNPPGPPDSLPPATPPEFTPSPTLPVGLGVDGTPPPMAAGAVSIPAPFVDGVPGNAAAGPPASLPPAAADLPATLPPLPDVVKADPPGPPDSIIPGPGNGKGKGKP